MTWWRKLAEPPTVEEVPAEPPPEPEPAVFTWLGEHCGRKGHRRYDDTAIDQRYTDEWGATA